MIQFQSDGAQGRARLKRLLLCGVGLLAACIVQPASAGTNTLTHVGPYGGSVAKVAFHPTDSSIAYATTAAGFYRSTDGGQSWQIVNDSIPNTAGDLAVHPAQPDRVFVVSSSRGVLASNDAGASLSVLSSSTGIHANDMDVEYSADGSVVYVSTGRQVWRSTNQGTTWLQGGEIPVGPSMAYNLIVDPTDSNRLYMAGGEPGVGFQSTDGGVTWQSWLVPNAYINDLAIADLQQSAPRIWAASSGGIQFSDDRGVSWTIALSAPAQTVTVHPNDPTIVYAGTFEGLLRSEDNGEHWSNIQGDAITGIIESLAIDPANSARLLLAGRAGLARSDNGGANWVSSQTGIDSLSSSELVSSPASDRIYINAFADSIHALSPEDGTTMSFPQLRQLVGFRGLQALGLMVVPGTPDRLFITGDGNLWRSLDGGETWSRHSAGTQGLYQTVTTSADGSQLLGTADSQLYSSADAGDTWTPLPALGVNNLRLIVSAPSNPQVIYLPGRAPGATRDVMLKSSDGGNTWTTYAFPGTAVLAIAVDPSNEQTLYVGGTLGEVFKSTNGGQTWASINVPGRYAQIGYGFWSLAIDPQNTNIVYAGGGSFMARSVDGGATWQQLWYDEERFLNSRTVVVDPLRPHSLYVGINGRGVREFSVQPDLQIAEIASDVLGVAGSYSYRISNAGPFDATNVRARFQLPPGSTNITVNSAATTCTVADTVVTCAAPIFRTGASADITIEAVHAVAGDLSVVGTIEGDQPDANTADNSVTTNTSTTELTDLSVTLTAPAFVRRGEQINLSLNVSNAGPNEAAFVSVRLELGAGLNIASFTISGGTSTPTSDALGTCVMTGNVLSCRLPQLPSGGSFTFAIVTSATTSAGSFGHTALVEGSGRDLGLRNNSASAATTVSEVSQGGGSSGGGGGSTSPFMIAALLLLSGLRAAANKFQRSVRPPLS